MESLQMPELPENQKTYVAIPEALIIDEIDKFMEQLENEESCEKVLQRLEEQHGKYRIIAYSLEARKHKLTSQIPDLQRSLEMIDIMRKQEEEQETLFLLSDQLYVKALVPPTKTVCLWLGANVMLEYSLDEGEKILKGNVISAVMGLKTIEHDQDYLRDQVCRTEVNLKRVYNWAIKKRQATKN